MRTFHEIRISKHLKSPTKLLALTLRRHPYVLLTPLSLHTSMKVLMDTIEGSVTRGISYGLAGVKSNEKNKNNKREYEINKKRKNKNSTKSSNEQSSNKNIQKGGS